MEHATPRTVRDRITAYLVGGGLFNPELANHDAVRDLLIDARDALNCLSEGNRRIAELEAVIQRYEDEAAE